MALNILVLGGSGFVGRHLIEHLQRMDANVTVPTRGRVNARELWPLPCVTLVEVDVTQPDALARVVPGHDAVINLVGTPHGTQAEFERLHAELPRQLVAACVGAGVRRVIHVSALGASCDAPSNFLRSKAAGEVVLNQAAADGKIDLTVMRPSAIYGRFDRFLSLFAKLQRLLPVICVGASGAKLQPVWVRDVADALARCLNNGQTIGQTYELTGPDIFTLRQIVTLAGQWTGANNGRSKPVIGVPAGLALTQAFFMELMPGKPLVSRDSINTLSVDSVATGKLPRLTDLGITPAAMPAVGPAILGVEDPVNRLNVLRQTAGR